MNQLAPNDCGPIYRESLQSGFPVEPWNTVSNLSFLFLILYWAFRLEFQWKKFPSIFFLLAFTSVGLFGGTLYHGTRSHCFWLFLDWIPIVFNVGVLSVVFWNGYFQNWKLALLFGIPPTLAAAVLQLYFGFQSVLYSTLAYLSLFLSVGASLFFWLRKNGRQHGHLLGFAMISAGLAFLSRLAERSPFFDFLTMGTHFLWHIFGAMTCHFVLLYLYRWQFSETHVNN